jgi:hypothetical protein
MGLDIKTYWLTDRQAQCDFDFDFDFDSFELVDFRDASLPGYELGSRKLSRVFGVGKLAVIKKLQERN